MKRFFFGGVHPTYNKEMSTKSAELQTIVPNQIIIPLLQHSGKPCTPLVNVGDRVLLGQKIGDGEGLCVPVHSSVSGTVCAIDSRLHPNKMMVDSIVIDNDFKDEAVAFNSCDIPTDELDTDMILHCIREAGIVGMGGAAFPGNVKAMSAMGNVDTLIANACECEPYITSDDSLLRTFPEQVFEGMLILRKVLCPSRMIIAIEDNKKQAIEKINTLTKYYPDIELAVLPTRYPQGSEKQLVQAITGKQIPPGGLPFNVGCAVFNVSTFAAIYKAVRFGMPVTQRIVTVSGEAISTPQNFVVRIGTPFYDIIKQAGGLNDKTERVISGGPMMGVAQSDLSVPVVKATNAIVCLLEDKNGKTENPVCIRCGKCISVCPMKLQPLYMYRFTLAGKADQLKTLNINDCIECGSCAFTCPGKLPLVEEFRKGKILLKEDMVK